MTVVILRLLADFGLVVLIWMIQLIVYPSFLYYDTKDLESWHRKYTPLIGFIVAPLMFLQLGIAIYLVVSDTNLNNLGNLLVIVVLWLVTFLQFVPMHGAISKGIANKELLIALVKKNWLRTLLWSLLFVLNIIGFVKL